MTRLKDITGQRFGMLLVLKRTTVLGERIKYLCKCDCGNEKIIYGENIRQGKSASCGCQIGGNHYIHGFTGTPEFDAWRNMVSRCTNPNSSNYKNYGGRGIKVCDRWLESFDNFLHDMGKRPNPKLSIDRIDNEKGYEPNNCKWATKKEQFEHRRPWGTNTNRVKDKSQIECKCGCGQFTSPGKRFIWGHNNRGIPSWNKLRNV